MSAFPAQRLDQPIAGSFEKDSKADISVLDPATVRDLATFERPHEYSKACVRSVLVNGQVVSENGSVQQPLASVGS